MTFRRVLSEIFEEVMSQTRMPPPPTIYSPEERPRPRLQPQPATMPVPASEERPRALLRPEPTPNEEQRPARPQPVAQVAQVAPVLPRARRRGGKQRAEIVAALSSPAGVRQALVLQEILGPPKSLRPWNDGESDGRQN